MMIKTYLQSIKDISPEHKEFAFRTQLENFLNAIKDTLALNNKALTNLHIKHEPNNDKEGRGAPDFQVLSQGLNLGYIENKRVGADLDSIIQSPQIEKYLALSDNLMLTDYLRFCLVRKNIKGKAELVKSVRICELGELKAMAKSPAGGGHRESKGKGFRRAFHPLFHPPSKEHKHSPRICQFPSFKDEDFKR